jgi:hypothetical protein
MELLDCLLSLILGPGLKELECLQSSRLGLEVDNVGKIRIIINEDEEVRKAVDREGAYQTTEIAMNELAWFQSMRGGRMIGVAV